MKASQPFKCSTITLRNAILNGNIYIDNKNNMKDKVYTIFQKLFREGLQCERGMSISFFTLENIGLKNDFAPRKKYCVHIIYLQWLCILSSMKEISKHIDHFYEFI